ncbi:MAG: bacteriocin fulvocin C-related protein [Prevotella sp.]
MKKLNLILIFLVSLCWSCSDNDTVYSCDETTNDWVKENITTIRVMSRGQWKTLNPNKKLAAFRAFSQEQRISFWKDKIDETLKLNWSKSEKAHILKLFKFIISNPDMFSDNKMSDEMQDKYDLFFYDWVETAKNNLKWDMRTIISIAASGDELINKNGISASVFGFDDSSGDMIDVSCHCNRTYDFCNVPFTNATCIDTKCEGTTTGCGWLLISSCNGRCDDVL